jgi:hypothetical protein
VTHQQPTKSGNAASGGFSRGRKSSEIFAATVLNSNRAVLPLISGPTAGRQSKLTFQDQLRAANRMSEVRPPLVGVTDAPAQLFRAHNDRYNMHASCPLERKPPRFAAYQTATSHASRQQSHHRTTIFTVYPHSTSSISANFVSTLIVPPWRNVGISFTPTRISRIKSPIRSESRRSIDIRLPLRRDHQTPSSKRSSFRLRSC